MPMRASGTSSARSAAHFDALHVVIAGNRPDRRGFNSRSTASRTATAGSCWRTKVLMASRLAGGVAMMERSRMPDYRHVGGCANGGGGEGEMSTSAYSALIFSFWRTSFSDAPVDDEQAGRSLKVSSEPSAGCLL